MQMTLFTENQSQGWAPPFVIRAAVPVVFLGVSKELGATHSRSCDLNTKYIL